MNGIYNIDSKKKVFEELEFNPGGKLAVNVGKIVTAYTGQKANGGLSYNLSGLSSDDNVVMGNDVSVTSCVFAGGLLGYAPEDTNIIIEGYNNKVFVKKIKSAGPQSGLTQIIICHSTGFPFIKRILQFVSGNAPRIL